MYQRNGKLGISNKRVRHPWFKVIVILFFILSAYPSVNYLIVLGKSRVETKLFKYISGTLTDHLLSGPPKYHKLLASYPAEPHPTDHRSLEKQKSININIAYYFIDTLASPHASFWHRIGGTIKQIIYHFPINHNRWRSMEHTWKTLIRCIEKGVKYTGKNVTKNHGRPYLYLLLLK